MPVSVSRKLRQYAEAAQLEQGAPCTDACILKRDAKRRARRAGSARARARARARVNNLVAVQTLFPGCFRGTVLKAHCSDCLLRSCCSYGNRKK